MGNIQQQEFENEIEALISSDKVKIPPFPAVASRLTDLIGKGDFDLREVVKLVSTDQVLVADTLRYANSSFYGGSKAVISLQAAISRIGIDQLLKLTYASSIGKHVEIPGPLLELRRQAWRQGLLSAIICQNLAQTHGLPPGDAFTCGLLHDIGRVIAVSCIEQVLTRHPDWGPRSVENWYRIVEHYHVALGRVMASKWKLPPLVVDVIGGHHLPAANTENAAYIEVVQIADHIVTLLEEKTSIEGDDLDIPLLSQDRDKQAIHQIVPRLPELVSSFTNLPVLQGPTLGPTMGRGTFVGMGPAANAPASMIQRAPTTLFGRQYPFNMKIVCALGDSRIPLQSERIATTGIIVRSPVMFPVNRLICLVLDLEQGPLELWAKVTLCTAGEGGYEIEAQAFALSGEVKQRFDALYREIASQSQFA